MSLSEDIRSHSPSLHEGILATFKEQLSVIELGSTMKLYIKYGVCGISVKNVYLWTTWDSEPLQLTIAAR
jgi:hypothetical protein